MTTRYLLWLLVSTLVCTGCTTTYYAWSNYEHALYKYVYVYRNFKRYFATAAAQTTRRIPLVSFFSPTKHFACILYI